MSARGRAQSALLADFDESVTNTFSVNLANGSYTVVPTLGNFSASQSEVSISLNGTQVASNLSTTAEQFISPAYPVTVTSGQLAVKLQDLAGGDFYIDGLSILPGTVQPPTASAGSAISADVGTTVSFSKAAATGQGQLSDSWYFGDGTSASSTSTGTLNPTHVYQTTGAYQALLTITDPNHLTVGSPVTVTVNALPVAKAGPNQTVNEETSTAFAGSVTGGTSPYTYGWNFGDGTTATGTLDPTHVYTTPGTYTTTLTVTDADGSSSQSSLVATVNDVAPAVKIGGPYQGNAMVPVAFSASATSVNTSEQSALVYSWNFGDGTTATGPSPSHAFASDGVYDVTLTVTDAYKGSTQATALVDILPSVSLAPVTVSAGATVSFKGAALGASSFTYGWNFGDSPLGTTANFIKTDTATQGSWIGSYGSQGYVVAGNAASYPSYATVTVTGENSYTWAASTTDARGLEDAGGSGRMAACWYSPTSFSINVDLTDGQAHDLALYAVDWDSQGRSEQIQITSAATGAVLDTETLSKFTGGDYLQWKISGNVVITVKDLAGPNAVISGLFIDPPTPTGANNTPTPAHVYANPGTYTATVTATDSSGKSSSASAVVTVVTPVTVTSHTPASGSTGVAVSTAPSATFNEAVQSGTIAFTLATSTGASVAGTTSYNATTNVVVFTPKAALAYGTTYTATVAGAENTAGVAMNGSATWSFTTDPTQPTVSSHTPASGTTGVAVSATPTATFNEAVQSGTVTFTLVTSTGTAVPGTASYSSTTNAVTFKPTAALAYGTTYTATVGGAEDSHGDLMAAPVTWSFTTDPTQPSVTSYTPGSAGKGVAESGASAVPVSTTPSATFNEAVQSGTITFKLATSTGTAVAGTTSYSATTDTVTFKPTVALAYGTTYTANVSGAEDTIGDPMAAPVTWSFTTDPTQPAVSSHTPASGTTGVAVSATPTATFNEAVQSGSITITLTSSTGSAVPGTASYSSTTNTETFKPTAALTYGTTYTATVSGAEDTIGDPMAAPVTWSFTTDPTQPTVSSHTPASAATGVAVSATPTATFNEAVQSGTVTFTLATSTGTAVPGTASYSSTTNAVTFKPTAAALAYGTTYTATVSGALDTDGDPMAAPVTWSFTTDSTQPVVTSHTPASAATGVAVSATPTATFNEAVQSGTITFTLVTSTGTAVPGTASYSSTTNAVTFKPTAALAYGTTYTATVGGAEDSHGDPMAAPVTWSFTTDPTQPSVTSYTPASAGKGVAASGASAVPVSTTPSATFNEAVQSGTITFTLATSTGTAVAGTTSYQRDNRHRDVQANRGPGLRHDLYRDRKRGPGHGRRSHEPRRSPGRSPRTPRSPRSALTRPRRQPPVWLCRRRRLQHSMRRSSQARSRSLWPPVPAPPCLGTRPTARPPTP